LFYSSHIAVLGFAIIGFGILAIFILQILGLRSPWVYATPAVVIWVGAYIAGIHPTLAGVVVGFMTPVTAWYGAENFLDHTEYRVGELRKKGVSGRALPPHLKS